MNQQEISFRLVSKEDADELLHIYEPYVLHTAITFEYEVPTRQEFEQRITHTLENYPYIAAEEKGHIIGYAYAGPLKERKAYDWAVEMTIYVDSSKKRRGIGKKLYQVLEQLLKLQGIQNLYACIGYPDKEDEYLTKNSAQFHEHIGYQLIGTFHNCGYKFNRWYHMIWMEKMIGTHETIPKEFTPFSKICQSTDVEKILKGGME